MVELNIFMDAQINILYVSHFPHLRMGGQKSMTHLIENLDRSRFRPFAVCPEPGELSEKLESLGCKCFFVPLYSMKPKYLHKAPTIIRRFRKIFKENNIHIVHPDFTADTLLCGLAKICTKTKMVWHVRWTEHFKKDRIHERLADAIIGVSDAAGTRFKNPRIRKKYHTIYNGVDCELFKPVDDKKALRRQLGIPNDRLFLIFVGVLKDGKGVLDIANAMSLLKNDDEIGQMPLIYYIGSQHNQKITDELNEIINNSGIGEDIKFIEQQSEVYKWMQAADTLLIPSHEGNEGMPRVSYEAMACGAAIIASDTSGVNEAITTETGILVNEKSPIDIALAVKKLLYNPQLLQEFSINGRKRALEFFDIKQHARRVEQVYLELLGIAEQL